MSSSSEKTMVAVKVEATQRRGSGVEPEAGRTTAGAADAGENQARSMFSAGGGGDSLCALARL
jgi:hypothetical protein